MQTNIHPDLISMPKVQEADAILRKCVHCGFCTATCPTYQLLGDELDGPRGRIYLIKNLLEDSTISDDSIAHLDRCLTCRACETTCPSGVAYGVPCVTTLPGCLAVVDALEALAAQTEPSVTALQDWAVE